MGVRTGLQLATVVAAAPVALANAYLATVTAAALRAARPRPW